MKSLLLLALGLVRTVILGVRIEAERTEAVLWARHNSRFTRDFEDEAASIKGSRYALVKNPEDLTDGQGAKLEAFKRRAGSRLVRAWELKEDLRAVFRAGSAAEAAELLDDWMHRAAYCKIAKVVAVEKKVRRPSDAIVAAVELGIGNGRVEAITNKIKVTVRMGYGFRNTDNLVALLMLRCGDCQPQLPGRPVKKKKRKKGKKDSKAKETKNVAA